MSRTSNFILTYVWLIVILFCVFLLLGTSKVLSPDYTCELEKGMYCKNVVLGKDKVTFLLQNEMDRVATISSINIKGNNLDCSVSGPIEVQRESERSLSLTCTKQQARFYDADINAVINNDNFNGRLTVKP